MDTITKLAKEICAVGSGYVKNYLDKNNLYSDHVRNWDQDEQHIKNAFIEIAKWHLARLKKVEAAKTSHNSRVNASRKKTRPA